VSNLPHLLHHTLSDGSDPSPLSSRTAVAFEYGSDHQLVNLCHREHMPCQRRARPFRLRLPCQGRAGLSVIGDFNYCALHAPENVRGETQCVAGEKTP
jgi:hypothetical protein